MLICSNDISGSQIKSQRSMYIETLETWGSSSMVAYADAVARFISIYIAIFVCSGPALRTRDLWWLASIIPYLISRMIYSCYRAWRDQLACPLPSASQHHNIDITKSSMSSSNTTVVFPDLGESPFELALEKNLLIGSFLGCAAWGKYLLNVSSIIQNS